MRAPPCGRDLGWGLCRFDRRLGRQAQRLEFCSRIPPKRSHVQPELGELISIGRGDADLGREEWVVGKVGRRFRNPRTRFGFLGEIDHVLPGQIGDQLGARVGDPDGQPGKCAGASGLQRDQLERTIDDRPSREIAKGLVCRQNGEARHIQRRRRVVAVGSEGNGPVGPVEDERHPHPPML